MRWLGLAIVIAACAHQEPVQPAFAAAGAQRCEDTARHLVALMQPEGAEPATVTSITRAVAQRCTDDHWTMDAVQCFAALPRIDDSDRCASLLSIDQRNAFDAAMSAALK